MTSVLMLAYNQVALSQRAAESILKMDDFGGLLVINQASVDGTEEWLDASGIDHIDSGRNVGITAGWNWGLEVLFNAGCKHALVVNNDVVLPPWFVSELESYDAPLVTGFDVQDMGDLKPLPRTALVPYPDFSAFLISKQCWETVGKFDERFFNYCSDCDYAHPRASQRNQYVEGERHLLPPAQFDDQSRV
jgi:GT2 family glycosyltransferase